MPVQIEEFVGHWMRLGARRAHATCGARARRSASGAVLGGRVWDRQHKFRIRLGPLTLEQYESFLPGGEPLRKLVDWVRMYLCFELDWDVRLLLKQNEVPPLTLGGGAATGLDDLARATAAAATGRRRFVPGRGSVRRSRWSASRMSEISRSALFGKLNSLAYKAIEGATVFCKLRGNPYVELVHWIQQILQTPTPTCIASSGTSSSIRRAWRKDVTEALDRLPRGATSISDLSAHVENAVERGWVYATLMFGEPRVRTGHLIVGMLKTPSLRNALLGDLAPVRADQARHADRGFRADRQRLARGRARRHRRLVDGGAGRSERRDGAGADGQAGSAQAVRDRT